MTAVDVALRRRRDAHGRRAERRCVWFLRFRGYRVLDRRARTPCGEIDIVARRGRTVVFVEVKARARAAEAAESVTPRQRRRIERAARHYIAHHRWLTRLQPRFDVMLVVAGRFMPIHMRNAWRPAEP